MSASSHAGSKECRKAVHRIDASRVWAVLIGINVYPSSTDHYSQLCGCVNNVEKMVEFLTDELEVPKDRIQCLLSSSQSWPNNILCNVIKMVYGLFKTFYHCFVPKSPDDNTATSPSRANIVNTLLGLSTNDRIHRGDNIIIYFSGHGSSYDCSEIYPLGDPSAAGAIEALCPMDRTTTATGVTVPDISDREVNTILTEISHTKGHHITFILDCCYSAGITRDATMSGDKVCHAPQQSISGKHMLDAAHTRLQDLPGYCPVQEGNWTPDYESHVVLAACEHYERAKEREVTKGRYNGIFTQALVEVLKADSLKEGSTYVDLKDALTQKMSPMDQTPVITGEHKMARLWYQDHDDIERQ